MGGVLLHSHMTEGTLGVYSLYEMKGLFQMGAKAMIVLLFIALTVGCGQVNTNYDPHFSQDGFLLRDSNEVTFTLQQPSKVKFYVEVSGSMNGFFRANQPTHFKADLWMIASYYSPLVSDICILTNDGSQGANYSLDQFKTLMNTGAFVSTSSTKVPLMLQTIVDHLDVEGGEVAVLVSDMKYSPVGAAAPAVLMTQYSTDISKIFGRFGQAVSLIGATSNYLDARGNEVCGRSPYYYLILGKPACVAEMRNGLSTFLSDQHHFVDQIETGFSFGKPRYAFGVANLCEQIDDEPTFVNYEEALDGDTCKIRLKVSLEDYRWLMAEEEVFRNAFVASSVYGSQVEVGAIKIDAENISKSDKVLRRKATAMVDLVVYDMVTDSEVIEWTLKTPDLDYTCFAEFFENASEENDPSKSYSLLDFVKGMFYGGVVNKQMESNYILISKNS